jgi:hypothetical protein
MPCNKAALAFWEKVVAQYSGGRFEKMDKIIQQPKPHPVIVLKFEVLENP